MAVAEADDAVGLGGQLEVVGDDHHGQSLTLVQVSEQADELARRLGVEGAGWLVGEQQGRAVDQRPSDRHPLLLAARQLVGTRPDLVG